MAAANQVFPNPRIMHGLTHDELGNAIVRVPRVVKVGIGLPKGKDIHVYIDAANIWKVKVGERVTACKDKDEAKALYRKQKADAPEVKFPRKLPYFTFTRPAGDGTFDPDFEQIEAHGPMPREIDIMFTDDAPFKAAYQMWSASQLQCYGDGINAMRITEFVPEKDADKTARKAAIDAKQKHFPIVEGCWTRGCPYAQPTEGKNGKPKASACKPHSKLRFQLLSCPRLGGEAQFDTTSFRSISQMFSCLQQFLTFTGNGKPELGFVAGIPLTMVLRPFRVKPSADTSGTAYSVSLEFKEEKAKDLVKKLVEHGLEFRKGFAAVSIRPAVESAAVEQRQLPAAADEPEEEFEPTAEEAATIDAEFNGGDEDEEEYDEAEEGEGEPADEVVGSRREQVQAGFRKLASGLGYSDDQITGLIDNNDVLDSPEDWPRALCSKYGPTPKNPVSVIFDAPETAKPKPTEKRPFAMPTRKK